MTLAEPIDIHEKSSQGTTANIRNRLREQHVCDGWKTVSVHCRLVSLLPSAAGNMAKKAANDESCWINSRNDLRRVVIAQSKR